MARQPKPTAPLGEQDLLLKLSMRRIFWGMNYATRLNLKLALPGSARTADELSDLDCVGFSVGGDFSIRYLIADCKAGGRVSPAARLFWIAGVRDFFGAHRAYSVMDREIPDGVRSEAVRLGVDILARDDRQILENVHAPSAPLAPFFEVDGAVKSADLALGMDRRLEPLLRFRDHDYWYLPPERRIQQLLAAVREVRAFLDVRQRSHVVLVIDLLFLLTLSLLGACRHVSATSLANPRPALLDFLLGGSELARAKQNLSNELARNLKQIGVSDNAHLSLQVEPPYFDQLAETVARLLRRPRDTQRLLRYIEWWGQAEVALGAPPVYEELGPVYGDITRKLVGDIARLCCEASGLGEDWMRLMAGQAVDGSADSAAGQKAAFRSPRPKNRPPAQLALED